MLAVVAEFRDDAATPVVLMGYANPVEAMGVDRFARDAARKPASTACWSSTIPPEEAPSSRHAMRSRSRSDLPAGADLDRGAHRRPAKVASGNVHVRVAEGRYRFGGARRRRRGRAPAGDPQTTGLPVGVGFGIRDAETAAALPALPMPS